MKFASAAISLVPAFLGKACAKAQAVLVEWKESVDEMGDEINKETVHAIDAAYSDTISLSVKQVVDTGVLNVYDWEEDDSMSMYGGSEMAVLSQEESFGAYAAAGDDHYLSAVGVEGVSKAAKSHQSKAVKAAAKSSKSVVVTSTTSSTSTAGTCSVPSNPLTLCFDDTDCTALHPNAYCSECDYCYCPGDGPV
jgi:hypothetical protein